MRVIGPIAIVEVTDLIEHLIRDAAALGDEPARVDAAHAGARIDLRDLPLPGDALGRALRFLDTAVGQLEVRAAAESLRLDTRYVPMTDEQDTDRGGK
jgi:hypothetical protein